MPAALQELAKEALSGARSVTARDVATFARSPFALWCEAHAPPERRDPMDEYLDMLFRQGREHEARILAQRYPGAEPLAGRTEEERFLSALDAMARGAEAIAGAPLFWLPEGLHGRADVLERRDDAGSAFGPWHYVVKEIKVAKDIQDHHVLQAALYNRMLGRLQGFTPAHVRIVDRDGAERRFAYDEPMLRASLDAVRAIREGRIRPDPVHGGGIWPWESYTDACAEAARDASLVCGVGGARRASLVAAGFRTVDAIAEADEEALRQVKGIGPKLSRAFRTSARAILEGRHIPLARPVFRARGNEVFLDLEGTGAQLSDAGLVEMDYLIGAWVRGPGAHGYVPFVAATPEQEGEMWRAFVAWFAQLDDPVLYHWSPYERTHLRRLKERHGLDPGLDARLFGSLVDLLPIARESVAFPTYGNSIKRIAPYCGFRWRHQGVGAMTSIAHYLAYATDPGANAGRLQLVLDYNEDDCIAMRVVKDWLVANA